MMETRENKFIGGGRRGEARNIPSEWQFLVKTGSGEAWACRPRRACPRFSPMWSALRWSKLALPVWDEDLSHRWHRSEVWANLSVRSHRSLEEGFPFRSARISARESGNGHGRGQSRERRKQERRCFVQLPMWTNFER
jgi:hypothetical protein